MGENYRTLINQDAWEEAKRVVIDHGSIDDHGLILPVIKPNLEAKIAVDINDVHHRILLHASKGKHILYLPGCYDLVHVGHASYVQQVIKNYLDEHPKSKSEVPMLLRY